jgi:Holliday junction DNA helicase RuvA
MIYTVTGKIVERNDNYLVLEVFGFGLKVFANNCTLAKLSPPRTEVKLFTFFYVREEQFELYGFLKEEELRLFEMLNTVAGIGPKTALAILDSDSVENVMAAIIERRAELLTKTSGIGQKTAERIILELHNKIKFPKAKSLTKTMDLNAEVEEALVSLGYRRSEIRKALERLGGGSRKVEERLRAALKILSNRPF